MVCPSCGFKTEQVTGCCPRCGRDLGPERRRLRVRLRLTPEEARDGARRVVRLPGRAEPLRLKLPPGLQTGDVLAQRGIRLDLPERPPVIVTLLMTVEIVVPGRPALREEAAEPRKAPGCLAAAARSILVLLMCAVLVCAFLLGRSGFSMTELLDSIELPVAEKLLNAVISPTGGADIEGDIRTLAAQEIWRFEQRSYINQLDDRLLADVLAIYRAVTNFEPTVSLPNKLSEREIISICNLMALDCTEILQTDLFAKRWEHDSLGRVHTLHLSYVMDAAEYAAARSACQSMAERLAAETDGQSDIERELYVYNYLTANCDYDRGAVHAFSPYGAFVLHSAKCDGLSKAIKWALDEMGIACRCISGSYLGRDDGHTWCTVLLDGTWYDVDVTADVNRSGQWQPQFRGAVNVAAQWVRRQFELDPGLDIVAVPEGGDMSRSAHVLDGTFIYSGQDAPERLSAMLDACCSYGGSVCFQIEDESAYEYIKANFGGILADWFERNEWAAWSYQMWYSDAYRTMYVTVSQ